MCGIVGYIGNKNAQKVLLKGLKALEYRGYDSAGFALAEDSKIQRVRSVGDIGKLKQKLGKQLHKSHTGIAHTRWATHGEVTENNAHPHFADQGRLALVHNGIIENYREIKERLPDNIQISSETDSEILAHLIAVKLQKTKNLREAVRLALSEIRGTYGILVMHADFPDKIIAARNGSPMALGIAGGEYILASDTTPILPYTKEVIFLEDGELAEVTKKGYKFYNLQKTKLSKSSQSIPWDIESAKKQGFDDFMLKEIHDQPDVLLDAIRGRSDSRAGKAVLGGLNMTDKQIKKIKRVIFLACGTASYAARIGQIVFQRLAGLPTSVEIASEFSYSYPIIDENTLVFAVSQSGETIDTLLALREAKNKGAQARGIVNAIGSTIAREAGAGTYIHAGPELSVASTKAYSNMIAVMLLYAIQFGRTRGNLSKKDAKKILSELNTIPDKISKVLDSSEKIKKIAEKYAHSRDLYFLGRGINYPVALEGSLKLKEIAYIHSEAYPGGEMKHGPIALIEKGFPIIAMATSNHLYEKMKSSIIEAKTRGAEIVMIASRDNQEAEQIADHIIFVPKTLPVLEPFINTVPLQLFAYFTAKAKNLNIDRPRNLAKSVTVE